MIAALITTATALWPWLAVLALVGLCAFIRDGRSDLDALLAEDAAETEARRVMCEANETAFDRMGATR